MTLTYSVVHDSPHPDATRCCDAGSLHILPATTGAHVLGGIPGSPRFPLGGVASPPMRVTSTRAPHGVSLSLPLSSSSSLFSSAVSSCVVASSLSLSGCPSLCQLAALWGRVLFRLLRSPSPLPLPLLSPSPLHPLQIRPPCLLALRIFQACCGGAGVWPVCGTPPVVSFIIRAIVARII